MWSVKQKEAFDKSFVSFEAVNIRKDGSKFPVNVDLTVIKNEYDEILYYIANVRDITVKKEIADSLKKSEEAFRAMVENSPDVIMRYDRDYRRTYINPIGLLLMGKSESELLGKTPREFSPLPNLEEFEKAFYTVITEAKEVKIEGEFIIPNGERRWGEQRIVPELNQYGEVVSVLVIGRDITELRKANKELLFKNFAMENVNESIFLVDETGKFKYVNQGACKALGYTNDELLLLSVGDIDPDWPNDRWPGYWEILKQEKTMTMELHHKRKDGSIFPVEVVANYIEYEGIGYNMGLVRDISERKNAENEIKEREEKFSKLFMSSPAAVSVTSIDRNMYLEVNDSFLYFTKYTRDEVVGKSSADLQLFANLDERAEFFRRVLEEGVVRGYEFEYRAKDGTTGYGIAYATLLNIQGERCVLAHSYDINATKQLELVSTAINSTSEAVYITDETFSIIYVNDGACKMLGYTKEELTSMRVYDVDVLYSLEDLSTIKETKRLNQQIVFETKHKRKNGTIIDVEIAGGSFSFHNKTVFVSVVKDITAKKEYEKQLHLLQTAINNASDAIYIIGDTREIKYVSDTSCKMLGYSVDEFLTMKVEDIDPYMSLDEIIGVREKVKDFNSTTFQTQHRTKNGNILNVEITVTKFIFNDTVLNLSIVKDITRQIRQEEEIRELNKTLEVKVLEKTKELEKALQFNESIINAIPDMLFEISKECVYLNIWARDEKLLAQQKEILLGKSFKDMLPPDAVAVSMKTMEEVDMYGSSLGNIYKLDFPDGEHWFELHTTKKEPEGTYLALVRDITERKKAQNALVELNATLEEKIEIRTIELRKALDFNESIINALPDLLFEIDINGVYLNLWARDEKLLAQQKEILLSKNVKDILSQESAQIVMQAILEAKENGFSFGKVLFINVQDDIKKFELSVSKKSDGHFLILSRDISSLR
jgi:PAS domain S-box-containing protein